MIEKDQAFKSAFREYSFLSFSKKIRSIEGVVKGISFFTQRSFLLLFWVAGLLQSGCMTAYQKSIGGGGPEIMRRVYLADYDTAWQAVLEALKNTPMNVHNREGGFLETKWIENTTEKNFTDSFGSANAYLKARMRFRVSLAKGSYQGKETVKVSLEKEQEVELDVLEGWQPRETDGIEEKTLLYRIGRLIQLRTRLNQLEEMSIAKDLEGASSPSF